MVPSSITVTTRNMSISGSSSALSGLNLSAKKDLETQEESGISHLSGHKLITRIMEGEIMKTLNVNLRLESYRIAQTGG